MKLNIGDIYSKEGRAKLIEAYTKSMWAANAFQKASWLGAPLLQTGEDLLVIAKLIWKLKPDFVVECGSYRGGGLGYYASIMELGGHGKAIGIDVEGERAKEVFQHVPASVAQRITVIEGSTVDPKIVDQVKANVGDATAIVILDSDHSAQHVGKELEIYHPMVKSGYYLVVMDGIMEVLGDVPGLPKGLSWKTDNPETAIRKFLENNREFERDLKCNELGSTFAPGGFLLRK